MTTTKVEVRSSTLQLTQRTLLSTFVVYRVRYPSLSDA